MREVRNFLLPSNSAVPARIRATGYLPSRAAPPAEPILVWLSTRLASGLQLPSASLFGVRALTGRSSGTRRHRALCRQASLGIIFLLRAVRDAPLSLFR